jgi:hypothetical protein
MRRDRRPGVDTSSEQAFGRTGVGVSNIFGSYYYTYLMTSLVAGLALDRAGAKYVVPFDSFVLGIGCLLFVVGNSQVAYVARLLQGAGSPFSFTGAVYLAVRGLSANFLATAIGVTQSLGMPGGLRETVCRWAVHPIGSRLEDYLDRDQNRQCSGCGCAFNDHAAVNAFAVAHHSGKPARALQSRVQ